ncbi:hypothetical protein BX666DRAFT_1013020 [Dichotomocladium elegans]|nr:hypothetical protein BX666DRAFT_1013020 [Dichotomocladium elegans]
MGMPSQQHHQQRTPPLSTSPTSIGSRARSSATTDSVPSPKSLKRVSLPSTFATVAAAAAANAKPSLPPASTKKILVPWRNPGKWQIPDVIEEAWKRRQQELQQQEHQRKLKKQQDDEQKKKEQEKQYRQLHERPWIPVGRVPDIWPIPPPVISLKPKEVGLHPEFESKLKKILPRSKAMGGNPYKLFGDTAKIGSGYVL